MIGRVPHIIVLAILAFAVIAPLHPAWSEEARLLEDQRDGDKYFTRYETVFDSEENLLGRNIKAGLCFSGLYAAANGFKDMTLLSGLPVCETTQRDGKTVSECVFSTVLKREESKNDHTTPLSRTVERCRAGDPAVILGVAE